MPEPVECSTYLAGLRAEAEATVKRVEDQFAGLASEQRAWRPPEGGWGIADCLEHLTLTDMGYLDYMDRALEGAARTAAPPPFKPGRWAAKFIGMLEPEAPRRLKAPGSFKPDESEPPEDALERFLAAQARLQSMCETLEGVNLTKIKSRSPISGLIKFRVGDGLRLMITHDKRHVAQAERVLTHSEFPTGEA